MSSPSLSQEAPKSKQSFNIERMLNLIEKAIRPFPKAMLFELYEQGYKDPFEILIACMISIRTLDEVSLKVSLKLFAKARSPQQIGNLSLEELNLLLAPATYHRQKAERILQIAQLISDEYKGHLPCDEDFLRSLPGVGPKTANLVLGIACEQTKIGVDIHVHRVTNRWGYVQAPFPEKTEAVLAKKLPQSQWVRINALLVPFGKHICTGYRPHCTTCPVLSYCRQVGVHHFR